MRLWKSEEGVTLVELLAAVVVLSIVVVAFTNIGTTAFRWQAEDRQLNQAVLLAEQKMQETKRKLFQTWEHVSQETDDAETGLRWKIRTEPFSQGGVEIPDLMQVTVTISAHDLDAEDPAARKQLTELSTVVRKRESSR